MKTGSYVSSLSTIIVLLGLFNIDLLNNENHLLTITERLNNLLSEDSTLWNAKYNYAKENDNKKSIEIYRFNRGVKDILILTEDDLTSDEAKVLNIYLWSFTLTTNLPKACLH